MNSTMNANDLTEVELDDNGTGIVELLERAEKSFRINNDNKYYVTLGELFLLASQPDLDRENRVELDCSGNWVIEIYYSGMIFIHVTSFQAFSGETIH